MNPGSANLPVVYRLAVGASMILGASWLAYLVYLISAPITRQSVYMGPITFYAGALMAISGAVMLVIIGGIAILARAHQTMAKRAALWGAGALLIGCLVFAVTRPLIDRAV